MDSGISRREFLRYTAIGVSISPFLNFISCTDKRKPNIIIVFCDDLGYGDLGVFGHPSIRTPHLDKLANEGQKWTNFYVGASVCTPSRAALLTGRLPIRSGMCSDKRRVLFPNSAGGLPATEITIAEALKKTGYRTACIGKWHLGHLKEHLPTNHGFDYYYGIPYSNDMDAIRVLSKKEQMDPKVEYYNVPLIRNKEIIERPANQKTITKRYNDETLKFIQQNQNEPFFLYLSHNLPHIPLFVSSDFEERSPRGLYGDVIEEIDYGIGEIIKSLRDNDLDRDTFIVFTSDNGPWLTFDQHSGSAGLFRNGKGTTWEGGMRVPAIFWYPGKIQPEVITGMGSTLDLFTTICNLADADVPQDRIMDSHDLSSTLFRREPSPRDVFYYYRGTDIYAVRKGSYKIHFITEDAYKEDNLKTYHDPPLLFNLQIDPGEKYNISEEYPEVIQDILNEVKKHKSNLVFGEDQLAKKNR
ncbi:sulfatase [Bacteroidota bacterium]